MITRALAAAALASIVAFGVQTWRLDMAHEDLEAHQLQAAQALAAAERQAREQEQLWAENARKAAQTYAQQTARVRADAGAARSALDRLRDTVNSGSPYAAEGAASAARADVAKRLAAVVNECSAALYTVAADADATAAKLAALQAYVAGLQQD